jgi:aspartyl-tRNA(Asn)/glutamyl-tRNA(Gln) amidotransferase subunit A
MTRIEPTARALAEGATTARALVETCLARIADPAGEGAATFRRTYAEAARAGADAIDALRRAGRAPSSYAGIPISLKDLLDVAGEPTPAGSRALADAPPAAAHAPVVARLLAAGFIPIGRSNMVEFAFSGLGINPHFGTPRAPWERTAAGGRIPGGSSSGAAVSVADGMALGAIGTDTGGSCRIPAAFCGITGYKPTARRVPIAGVLPLAPSLDSVGPLAASVACCAILDAVLAGEEPAPPVAAPLAGLRLAVPESLLAEGLAPEVAAAFTRALSRLEREGARLTRLAVPEFDQVFAATAAGGLTAPESFAWHRALLAEKSALYDPAIRARIERGAGMSAADYLDVLAARRRLIAAFDRRTDGFDAMVLPTAPILPARIADLVTRQEYNRVNMLTLRHTTLANFLDRCAISLPCHAPGEPPVGLMLMGETMGDRRLLAIAAGVEAALAADTGRP